MSDYFSDRELGPRPRVEQQISLGVWRARDLLVQRRIDDGSFGFGFPEMCPDGRGPCGSSPRDFWTTAEAEIPGVNAIRGSQKHRWLAQDVPPVLVILDLFEFCARHVARPVAVLGRYTEGRVRDYRPVSSPRAAALRSSGEVLIIEKEPKVREYFKYDADAGVLRIRSQAFDDRWTSF